MLRVFITNLARYDNGELIGKWIELPIFEEDLQKIYDEMGFKEDDEIFVTDYESNIDGIKVNEYDSIEYLNELAEKLDKLDDRGLEIVKTLICNSYDIDRAIEKVKDCILYSDCEDMDDVAREYVYGKGLLEEIPQNLRYYFDFKAYGDYLETSGEFYFTNNYKCVQVLR